MTLPIIPWPGWWWKWSEWTEPRTCSTGWNTCLCPCKTSRNIDKFTIHLRFSDTARSSELCGYIICMDAGTVLPVSDVCAPHSQSEETGQKQTTQCFELGLLPISRKTEEEKGKDNKEW